MSIHVTVSYKGMPGKIDKDLEHLLNKKSAGSGYCFLDGVRDIEFTFRAFKDAEIAKQKIKEFAKSAKRKLNCEIVSYYG